MTGVLKAIGFNDNRAVCEFALKTAGPAGRIELLPDVNQIQADGKDICHVEFRIVDDKGVRVPDAEHELVFVVDGPGNIIGIENGNLNSIEDYKDLIHKAYNGRGLAILQSTHKPGTIRRKAVRENAVDSPHESIEIKAYGDDQLILTGKVTEGVITFEARLQVVARGGDVTITDQAITVENDDSAMLLLAATVHSLLGNPCNLRCGRATCRVEIEQGQTFKWDGH